MKRPLRSESRWHQASTALLFGIAVVGFPLVLPCLFLIPAVLCTHAGRAWAYNEPEAPAWLQRAHSTAIAFLSFLAILAGLATLSAAFTEPRELLGVLVAAGAITAVSLVNLLLSLKALPRDAAPHIDSSESQLPSPTGVQVKPSDAAQPEIAPEPRSAAGSGVDWHRFLSAVLYLCGTLSAALITGFLLQRRDTRWLLPWSLLLIPTVLFMVAVAVSCSRIAGARVAIGCAATFVLAASVLALGTVVWPTDGSSDLPPRALRFMCAMTVALSALIALGATMTLRTPSPREDA
ncbi:MAG: hypothetical protein ACRC33_26795 [Gemmataceae bacterium]